VLIGAIILTIAVVFTTFFLTSAMYLVYGRLPFYGIITFGDDVRFNNYKINQVKSLIDSYYIEPVENDVLIDGAIQGLANAVGDPYTTYMDAETYRDFMTQATGQYGGIGVVVTANPETNKIVVVSPIEGTPGEEAGLLPGDSIIRVNGEDVLAEDLDKAVNMMRGPENTELVITIEREGVDEPWDVPIMRAIVELDTIRYEILDNKIGYIRISMFDEKTSSDFNEALNNLYGENMESLIIDVRDNPGGALNQVVRIADYLISEGMIVYTEDREGNVDVLSANEGAVDMPLAILINEGSASASEILAGAVKDHGKGVLIGKKTFGKGLVQNVFDLGDDTAVKVTISEYFTPNGISINGKGIEPDIEVDLPEDIKDSVLRVEKEDDTQLNKAIEWLIDNN
jgi:carboxyl-terminal processing protease